MPFKYSNVYQFVTDISLVCASYFCTFIVYLQYGNTSCGVSVMVKDLPQK